MPPVTAAKTGPAVTVGGPCQDGWVTDAAIYAVSDVHGHLHDLRRGLRDLGLVDCDDAWVGGDAQLWVLGDLLDRGPDGLGVVRFLRGLQRRAPGRVHVLLGNHEVLALGKWLHPDGAFDLAWRRNGGLAADQHGLSVDDVTWLRALPAVGRVGRHLLVHSDTTAYLGWGSTIDEVNRTVAGLLRGGEDGLRALWRGLTTRLRFTGPDGTDRARELLEVLGGDQVVHGHSIIGTLTGEEPAGGAHEYADGLALAIDGGRYGGGPLLVVRLDQASGSAARVGSRMDRATTSANPR